MSCQKSPTDSNSVAAGEQATSTQISDPDGDALPSSDDGKTIKVGILQSLTGSMAISEVSLKNTALMAIDEINAQGGLLGRKVEPIVVDAASDWPIFGQKAESLIEQHHVAAIFGGSNSASRKYILPVVERYNALLFYPMHYEGQEQSRNIYYLGGTPNQQAIPAVDYLRSPAGGSVQRFVLLGTESAYSRTLNRIMHGYLKSHGVPETDILEQYTPAGFSRYKPYFDQIRQFSQDKKTAIVSTLNGDSNIAFYQQAPESGIDPTQLPVMNLTVGEAELKSLDTSKLTGHLAAWNYFQAVKHPANAEFVAKYRDFIKRNRLESDGSIVITDPMEATYIGINLWKQAVKKAGSTDVDQVRITMTRQRFEAPSGYTVSMDGQTQHLARPVMIGKIRDDGQFDIVYRSAGVITPQPWSKYMPKAPS